MSDDLDTRRKEPPTDDEWPHIWEILEKAEKAWPIVGPIHAAVTNWKAWCAIAAVVVFVRGDDILEFLRSIGGSL